MSSIQPSKNSVFFGSAGSFWKGFWTFLWKIWCHLGYLGVGCDSIFNRKIGSKTQGEESEICWHLPGGDGPTKDAIRLHYGKCRIQGFWAWPILGSKCLNIALCWFDHPFCNLFLASPPISWQRNTDGLTERFQLLKWMTRSDYLFTGETSSLLLNCKNTVHLWVWIGVFLINNLWESTDTVLQSAH